MPQIFISHSRYDEDIRKYFDEIFAGTTVKAVRLEFERYEVPPSKFTREQIRASDAVFVLLGPNITRSPFTQIWVAFETGCAAGYGYPKDIWVFEPIQYSPIQFPVPFLHHYMLYDPNSREHREYITSIVKAYEAWIPLFRSIPSGWRQVTCPYDDCGMSYIFHTISEEIYCPTCRRGIRFRSHPARTSHC